MRGITLFVLGGVSRIASEPRTAGEELRIAAAGPAVSLALAMGGYVAAVVSPKSAVYTAIFAYFVLVNLALAAFNLVPALPLDGGRVLRAAIWRACGDANRATRYCAWAGRGCGALMVCAGLGAAALGGLVLGFWLMVIGLFIERSARASWASAAEDSALQGVPASLDSSSNIVGTRGRRALALAGATIRPAGGGYVAVEDRYHQLLERVIMWRARLDVLPRPAEISDENSTADEGLEYQEARMQLYDALEGIDVKIRARLDESEIQRGFADLSALYDEWKPVEVEEGVTANDASDAILAGRPERFAPSPEEVLAREPGSSFEI